MELTGLKFGNSQNNSALGVIPKLCVSIILLGPPVFFVGYQDGISIARDSARQDVIGLPARERPRLDRGVLDSLPFLVCKLWESICFLENLFNRKVLNSSRPCVPGAPSLRHP